MRLNTVTETIHTIRKPDNPSSTYRSYVNCRVFVLFAWKIRIVLTVDRQSQINLQIAVQADQRTFRLLRDIMRRRLYIE